MKNLQILIMLVVLVGPFSSFAGVHDGFDALLQKYVAKTTVDYKGLKSKEAELDVYLKALANVKIGKLSEKEAMSLWINAYNACTLKLILMHYPVDSIKDISTSKRWKWEGWDIGGEKMSLDSIEHVKLRPMGDPRIHFAINCASFSCPALLAEAFTAEKLEKQLVKVTNSFFADEDRGMIVKEVNSFFGGKSEEVYISKIFSWFAVDFVQKSGSVTKFLKEYAGEKYAKELSELDDDGDLNYLDYDWDLNGK